MNDILEQLTNRPLASDGPVTRSFRAAGIEDFVAAAHHIWKLPYGRIADRNQLGLVLSEGRGTCSYLRYGGERIDVTGVPAGAEPIEEFLHEEPIEVGQIGAYNNDFHKRFLSEWITRTEAVHGRSLEEVWRMREECIAALGAGEYAKPDN
jgi:hypothetical protein